MKYLLPLLLISTTAFAKWNNSYEFETLGVHENVQTDSYGETYAHDDSISVLQTKLRYKYRNFNFTADPQLRVLSTALEHDLTYPSTMYQSSIQAPTRGMNLESPLWGNSSTQAQAGFERLTLGFKNRSTEFVFGRQPFSLGLMKIVPIWNRFVVNLPLPGVFVQFPDRDGAAFRYHYNSWDLQVFSIFESQNKQNAYLMENTFNINSIELKLLGGIWQDNLSGGMAASIPFLNGFLRGELLSIGGRSSDLIKMNQFGLGFETALSSTWSIVLESLYLSTGAVSQDDYNISELNYFRPLLAQDYAVLQLKYDSGRFFTIEPEVILNIIDASSIIGGKFIYSLGDHSEISLQLRVPTGSTGKEFSTNASPIASLGPTGTADQILLKYRLFY